MGRYDPDQVVTICIDTKEQGEASLLDFFDQQGLQTKLVIDPGDEIAKAYGVVGLPTYYIIDRKGRIAATQFGINDLEEFLVTNLDRLTEDEITRARAKARELLEPRPIEEPSRGHTDRKSM